MIVLHMGGTSGRRVRDLDRVVTFCLSLFVSLCLSLCLSLSLSLPLSRSLALSLSLSLSVSLSPSLSLALSRVVVAGNKLGAEGMAALAPALGDLVSLTSLDLQGRYSV